MVARMIVQYQVDFLVLDMLLLTDQLVDVIPIQAGFLSVEFAKVNVLREVLFQLQVFEMNALEQQLLILYPLAVFKTQTQQKETVSVTQQMTTMRTQLLMETKLNVSLDVKLTGPIKQLLTMIAGHLQLPLELTIQMLR